VTRLPYANTPKFCALLGRFYATWSRVEIVLDCAIWKVLGTTPEQAHAVVAGMEFGRKSAVLRSLLATSKFENVDELKGILTRITKTSLRNTFSHSFLASDENSVSFIHRTSQGQYTVKGYTFTADQFDTHVHEFVQLARDFERALSLSDREVAEFAAAALPPTVEKSGGR
jgi:hypothetical protein